MHRLRHHKVLRFHCAHFWLQLSARVDCFGHFHHLFVVGVVTIRWRSIYVNMMVKINQIGVKFTPVGKVLG
nr:MAG TPA: hypothetical protein [Caudoviricetes sp.]